VLEAGARAWTTRQSKYHYAVCAASVVVRLSSLLAGRPPTNGSGSGPPTAPAPAARPGRGRAGRARPGSSTPEPRGRLPSRRAGVVSRCDGSAGGRKAAADSREGPFYDRDGEHWITLAIELGADGTPPEMIELARPESAKRHMRCQYRCRPQPDSPWPWAYVEVSCPWRGSVEALRRLRESTEWPP